VLSGFRAWCNVLSGFRALPSWWTSSKLAVETGFKAEFARVPSVHVVGDLFEICVATACMQGPAVWPAAR